MTPDHQSVITDNDSDWEDIENEQDLYPTFDVNSETWAEELTNSMTHFKIEVRSLCKGVSKILTAYSF